MATPSQINANRTNSTHSTGPTTDAGKSTCSLNSLKHGLASSQLIIPGESEEEFNALLTALLDEHQPETVTETICVQDMAKHHWLIDRALRFQNDAIVHTLASLDQPAPQLPIFFRYQTINERAYQRAFTNLQTLRKARLEQATDEIGSAPQTASTPPVADPETTAAQVPSVEEILKMMSEGWFYNIVTRSYEPLEDEDDAGEPEEPPTQ